MHTKPEEMLSETSVYPGHALTVGLMIMMRFENLAAATLRGEHCPAALSDGDIPGAGGRVYAALDLLDKISKCHVSLYDAAKVAAKDWESQMQGEGRLKDLPEGQAQADRLQERFEALATLWLAPENLPKVDTTWKAKDGRIMQVLDWTRPTLYPADDYWANVAVLNPAKGQIKKTTMPLKHFGTFLQPSEPPTAAEILARKASKAAAPSA